MASVPAGLPAGIRLTDHISLGVIARAISPERVREVLAETGTASERERDLPAQVMVYYVIALALYMGSSTREVLRCLLEGLRWLWGAEAVKVAGKSGISQARSRLGEAPLRQRQRIRRQNAVNHPKERAELALLRWLRSPIAGRHREPTDLVHRLPRQAKHPGRLTLTVSLHEHELPNRRIDLHCEHLPGTRPCCEGSALSLAGFHSANSGTMPPLQWPVIAPPRTSGESRLFGASRAVCDEGQMKGEFTCVYQSSFLTFRNSRLRKFGVCLTSKAVANLY